MTRRLKIDSREYNKLSKVSKRVPTDVKLHQANKLYSEEMIKVLSAYTNIVENSFGT